MSPERGERGLSRSSCGLHGPCGQAALTAGRARVDVYRLLRPLLFALPPEIAHSLALAVLRHPALLPAPSAGQGAPVELRGVVFPNRLGVAAGLDKNAVAVAGLAKIGFGFVEVGTVTPWPQAGNAKPRLFRLPEDGALVNRMGFNSVGAQAVAANLARRVGRRSPAAPPIGINIGMNRNTPAAATVRDYRQCLEAVHDMADFVVVNVSSPNTPGLARLRAAQPVRALVGELTAAGARLAAAVHGRPKPLLVKLSPDLPPANLESVAAAALEASADGFVAVNTTTSRPSALRSRHRGQAGGLSGRPLFATTLDRVRRLRKFVGDDPLLIGVGGVSDETDFRALRDAGADLVQIYTALVYRGPNIVPRLAAA